MGKKLGRGDYGDPELRGLFEMLAVKGDKVRCPGSHCHLQNHVILRIRKNAAPKVVNGLLPGKLCDPVDHVIDRRCRDQNPASRAVADIIVFREQRNGQCDLEFTPISRQQNLMAGT